jgi:UrcA family protein
MQFTSRRIVMLMHQTLSAPVRIVGMAVTIVAASLFANVASAQGGTAVSTVVAYSDLDLSMSGDAARLYSRLQYAAKKVCNSYDSRNLRTMEKHEACYADALNAAVDEVDDAKLTALHTAEPRIRVARG